MRSRCVTLWLRVHKKQSEADAKLDLQIEFGVSNTTVNHAVVKFGAEAIRNFQGATFVARKKTIR